MSDPGAGKRLRAVEVIERYGKCIELISMDAHFHDITVALYVKGPIFTVWSFSKIPGVEERIRKIRDQMVSLGGMEPVADTHDQVTFPCGELHLKPVKFLLTQAVGKDPEFLPPEGEMRIQDTKSKLMLVVTGAESEGRYLYGIRGEGEAPNPELRLRMVVAGFISYGEMEKVGDTDVSFLCGRKHDGLVRLLMPYSRNISAVESMLAAEAMRGQMTTGTLGFAQS